MDEIYKKIADFNPRRFSHSPDVRDFDITELWRSGKSGAVRAVDRRIVVTDIAAWLANESQPTKVGTESLVLRLVWTSLDFEHKTVTVGLPETALTAILDKFGLKLAHSYLLSCVTGINAFPKNVTPGFEQQAYSFSYAPKIASSWSHTWFTDKASLRHPVTYGIVLAGVAQKEVLKKLLHNMWQPNLSSHAMFPAFLYTFMLSAEIEKTVESMKARIQAVESRTGYQGFKTTRGTTVIGIGLGELSAEMSGYASKLASAERKSMTLEKLMDFILKHTGPPVGAVSESDSLMKNHTSVLKQRLDMQVLDKSYTLKRVQVQIEALVNLISQHDNINNTDIAISSHRDASSMKTLAFVTMFFLPGSFVAALFSTDCFGWDKLDDKDKSIGVPTTPQFKLYWAITIPMTVLTFVLYFVWLAIQAYQSKIHAQLGNAPPDDANNKDKQETETALLAKKRFSMLR
ncbi:hypothetical protein EDB81DRAFT_465341 [Dactylonectria macrodidyma]|uniref:Uncharacterized protein n=1 Tax=Dactylonectria macrodidyma TaxID=307937 RepID=A0A9P9EYX1_9HYPO|nr:hypothetical protein EDB81DRAFT_465341 [Dactylonectria macrodidyma]